MFRECSLLVSQGFGYSASRRKCLRVMLGRQMLLLARKAFVQCAFESSCCRYCAHCKLEVPHGFTALHTQKREASADPSRMYHSDRENSVQCSSSIRLEQPLAVFSHLDMGQPVAMFAHKRKSSREFHPGKEGDFVLEIHTDRALQGEQEALSERSEVEFHTRILLEERGHKNSLEQYSHYFCTKRRAEYADSSIQNLSNRLRPQGSGTFRRRQEHEFARHEKDLLCAELQSKEREGEREREYFKKLV